MPLESFASRSNRSRATFSTESRITANNKKEAVIPTVKTSQGSMVERKTGRVALFVAVVIVSIFNLADFRMRFGTFRPILLAGIRVEKAGLLRPFKRPSLLR